MTKEEQQSYMKIVVVAVIVGVVAFGAGVKWQQRKIGQYVTAGTFMGAGNGSGRAGGMMGGNAQGRTGGGRGGFRPVAGEIISSDEKSVTVKLADGSSKIVLHAESTTINKADTAAKSDLVAGKQVAVFGSENTDGSITASSIQLDPVQMGMMRTGTPSASSKPNAY